MTEQLIQIECTLVVKAELANMLVEAAKRRERTPASIMAEIIETVLSDNLVGAILDDGQ